VISTISEVSLVDAARSNLGFFIDDNVRVGPFLTLKGGARFDVIGTGNTGADGGRLTRNDLAVTAYLGGILQLDSHLSLIANLGRSFRFPTVSELFYSGLTGRGTVFGNPDLDPESGINLDFGIRYLHSRFYASVYAFRNFISNMIQKYQGDAEEEYFFRNLTSGRIHGIEGDFYLWPGRDFEFRINFHLMDGRDPETEAPLNYIPPFRIAVAGKWAPGRFWLEPKLTLSGAVDEPGPLEIAIDGYTLLDAAAGVDISRHLRLICIGQNLTDSLFRFSADESGVVAPGRGFILRAQVRF
jgi:outer membrane receptor protein involved in Fe transport